MNGDQLLFYTDGTRAAVVAVTDSGGPSMPPPYWDGLPYAGSPSDVVARANYVMLQAAIADRFGVAQQDVSRWIAGGWRPRSEHLPVLARLWAETRDAEWTGRRGRRRVTVAAAAGHPEVW